MSFMRRGGIPSIKNDNTGISREEYKVRHWSYRYRRYEEVVHVYLYVPLDNTYIAMKVIVTLIILIVAVITLLVTYKSTIIDPIESIKKLFINTYLIVIGILLAVTLITNFFSKSKTSLIKRLVIILAISIIIMIGFSGIKLNLDTTYTKEKFEQFYTEQNPNESSKSTTKSKIDIGITGVSIKTEKEYYISECSKLYDIFSTKVYGTIRTSSFT